MEFGAGYEKFYLKRQCQYWVGQKLHSDFPVMEKSKQTFGQPSIREMLTLKKG